MVTSSLAGRENLIMANIFTQTANKKQPRSIQSSLLIDFSFIVMSFILEFHVRDFVFIWELQHGMLFHCLVTKQAERR